MTEAIIGIDLGTTNSVIAALVDGRSNPIAVDGHATVPSAVLWAEDGRVVVGREARNLALQHPERTVLSVKRAMGTQAAFTIGDRSFTPEEVSAEILRHLAEAASANLGRAVRDVVITVPAYFDDAQRRATIRAGELAGLKVLRLVNEPTAAALIYEQALVRDEDEPETVLVYDLGGGTFDVSVLDIFDDVREVRATAGDSELGGDDFDKLLLNHFLDVLKNRDGVDPRNEASTMARLRRLAEETKIRLSDEVELTVREEFLTTRDGKPLHFELGLTRDAFEQMIAPHIDATITLVSDALKQAGVTARELRRVLLVGGSTRIPLVRQRLRSFLLDLEADDGTGDVPGAVVTHDEIDPDLAVGIGAAIQAGIIAGAPVDRILVDVASHSLGIAAVGAFDLLREAETFVPIIPKNTPLPASRTETFRTMVDDQEAWDVAVYQGEAPTVSRNRHVDTFEHKLLPRPADSLVYARFDYDLDGVVKVSIFQPGQTPAESARLDLSERQYEAAPSSTASLMAKALVLVDSLPEAERGEAMALISRLQRGDELDLAELEEIEEALLDMLMDYEPEDDEG